MRFAFGWPEFDFGAFDDGGEDLNGPGTANSFFWDANLLHYPGGNAAARPYLLVGVGAARVDFHDPLSERWTETMFAVPLAVGFKYRCHDWLALRFEFADEIAFGGEFDTVHDVSLTGGVEFLFGGTRRAYWPWNPGRHYY